MINIEYQLGSESGVKYFADQDSAVKFCESLYEKKLKSQGFTPGKLYGPASKYPKNYGSRQVKSTIKKLPRFKMLTEIPLKVKITHL